MLNFLVETEIEFSHFSQRYGWLSEEKDEQHVVYFRFRWEISQTTLGKRSAASMFKISTCWFRICNQICDSLSSLKVTISSMFWWLNNLRFFSQQNFLNSPLEVFCELNYNDSKSLILNLQFDMRISDSFLIFERLNSNIKLSIAIFSHQVKLRKSYTSL